MWLIGCSVRILSLFCISSTYNEVVYNKRMTYGLSVDNAIVLTGGTTSLILGASIILLALVVAFQLVARKLRQQEVFKYEFLTILAHKFRTPMTHIKWTLENIVPDETDPFRKK